MKNISMRVYLRPDQVDDLKLIAAHRGDTVSSVIRDMLRVFLSDIREIEPNTLAPLTPRRNGDEGHHDAT